MDTKDPLNSEVRGQSSSCNPKHYFTFVKTESSCNLLFSPPDSIETLSSLLSSHQMGKDRQKEIREVALKIEM